MFSFFDIVLGRAECWKFYMKHRKKHSEHVANTCCMTIWLFAGVASLSPH